MERKIVKDILFLNQPSEAATNLDAQVIQDLKDTLAAHRDHCAGMAANMIGYHKRIIIVNTFMNDLIMVNPEIIAKSGSYNAKEGCLSLVGERSTKRFQKIKVKYLDEKFKPVVSEYSGFIAEVIQHEIDHCNGIVI